MKLLFDTSSLIAAFVQSHPAHTAAWEWLEQTLEGGHGGVVATQTLAELYAGQTGSLERSGQGVLRVKTLARRTKRAIEALEGAGAQLEASVAKAAKGVQQFGGAS